MPEPLDQPTPHQAAHSYAARGWRVVPIAPGTKHPKLPAWQNAATTDADMIDEWWTGLYRGHGVGIATGHQSGIFVLDIDDHDALHDLTATHGPLPDTLTSLTGSGGQHLIFNYPANATITNHNRLPAGIDVRGDGGQIVAPPTVHPNGTAYCWDASTEHLEPADAPGWLLELVTHIEPQPQPQPKVELHGDRPGDQFAAAVDWADILGADGWTLHHVDHRTGERHWTRPGKDTRDGTSATTGYTDNDTLKVFTSSVAALDEGAVYSKLGYVAATRHQGDHKAAARSLAADGYGTTTDALTGLTGLPATPDGHTDSDETWQYVDMEAIATGEWDPPKPTLMPRNDGVGLFYEGRVHSIAGTPGGGKTWLALYAIAHQIHQRGTGALIDYEDTPQSAYSRLTKLGLTPAQIVAGFTYIRPIGPLGLRTGRTDHPDLARLADQGVDIVVIDSVGESLAVEGLPPNDDDAVTLWFRGLARPIARSGAAVVGLDHVTKSTEHRGMWAIGSQRKLAAIDGAAYGVESKVAPTKTKDGKLSIVCSKDRHGTHQHGHLVANVDIANVDGGVAVKVQAPAATFRPTHLMERVSRFLEDDGEASGRQIESSVTGNGPHIRTALDVLVAEGFVAKLRAERGHKYQSVTAYRDEEAVDNSIEPLTASTASIPRPKADGRGPDTLQNLTASTASTPYVVGVDAWTRSEGVGGDETGTDDDDRVQPRRSRHIPPVEGF
jgi:hypothetical protein